jgi:hypothetical protein
MHSGSQIHMLQCTAAILSLRANMQIATSVVEARQAYFLCPARQSDALCVLAKLESHALANHGALAIPH